MHFAAALLTLALAAPAPVGAVAAPVAGTAASFILDAAPGQTLDRGERRPGRARAPVAPPLRRLLRKRGILAPLTLRGDRFVEDPSLTLLALELERSSNALLGRVGERGRGHAAPLRLLLMGVRAHTQGTPPPTLAG